MRDLKVTDERAGEIARRTGAYRNHGCLTLMKRDIADLLADRSKLLEYWRDREMAKTQFVSHARSPRSGVE